MATYWEVPATDPTQWTIGPYHAALPGPLRVQIALDGEVMTDCQVERGFLHRGLEKAMERQAWRALPAYADHLDPEGAVFGELVVCLAVEQMAGLEVPIRAQRIRVLLCELSRLNVHLTSILKVAQAVGATTLVQYVLRDRERILDLFELVTGSRFSPNFLRYGGVAADVTEGFIERVLDLTEVLWVRLKEYNDIFTFNQAFSQRATGVGFLSPGLVLKWGLSGPNARASGIAGDVRKDQPYGGYPDYDFSVPLANSQSGGWGDIHARFVQRLREIHQTREILRQAADALTPGPFCSEPVGRDLIPPPGEAYVRLESPRGTLACHVISEGGPTPSRIQFRTPSLPTLYALPELVRGVRLEDLPLLLASLDMSVAEADR